MKTKISFSLPIKALGALALQLHAGGMPLLSCPLLKVHPRGRVARLGEPHGFPRKSGVMLGIFLFVCFSFGNIAMVTCGGRDWLPLA